MKCLRPKGQIVDLTFRDLGNSLYLIQEILGIVLSSSCLRAGLAVDAYRPPGGFLQRLRAAYQFEAIGC